MLKIGTPAPDFTTCLASATGILGAMATSWIFQHKPDLSMVLNGSLAGLVGITAGADVVSVNAAMVIGLIAGVIVVFSVLFIDRAQLDDPVGAVSVHLVCGVWGTMAVGIFSADHSVVTQAIGVLAYGAFCFPVALAFFFGLKMTMGLRVTPDEESLGLDVGDHPGDQPPVPVIRQGQVFVPAGRRRRGMGQVGGGEGTGASEQGIERRHQARGGPIGRGQTADACVIRRSG